MKTHLIQTLIIALASLCLSLTSCSKKEPEPEELVTPEQKQILDEMSGAYEK